MDASADDEPAAAFDPDALLPRTDISTQLSSKLVANIGSSNWKERNAALEEVEEIMKSAGGRIQPSVGDLMPALKVWLYTRAMLKKKEQLQTIRHKH